MDIKIPALLYLKAGLFILSGLLAGAILIADLPTIKTAALLIICIWCFARAYYFAFYVIQHYIDPAYRFAGLFSMLRYLLRSRTKVAAKPETVER